MRAERVPDGGLVILAGPAGAGKARLLTEALLAEVPGWQLLRPDAPQVNGLVSSGADLSKSVLWLDELQTFFTGDPLSVKSVGALLAGRHGPVLLAGTIRAEERDRLANLLSHLGHDSDARDWYRRGAEIGDARAAAARGPGPGAASAGHRFSRRVRSRGCPRHSSHNDHGRPRFMSAAHPFA